MASHLGTVLEVLGPHTVRTVARLTMTPELHAVMDITGVLGMQKGGGCPWGNTTW